MPNENGIKASIKNTIDTKQIQRLMEQANVQILVGYPSGMQHVQATHRKNKKDELTDINGNTPDQMTPIDTADLAKMLHYGTAEIPARPFLEEAIRQNTGKLRAAVKDEVMKIKDGKKANWNKVGTLAVGCVNELVRSDWYKQRKPNSKKTIEHKGSDIPLIDSANMLQSTAFLVNGGSPHFPLKGGKQ